VTRRVLVTGATGTLGWRVIAAARLPGRIAAGYRCGANLAPENPVGTIGFEDYLPQTGRFGGQTRGFVVGSALMTSNTPQRDASLRAADTDRIQVAQLLTDAAAQGRLQMTEYEDRLTKVYAAKTYDELDRLSNDLPGAATRPRHPGVCRPAPSTLLFAIMSGFERRGRWNVPRRLTTFALWGGGVVDLRYADFTSPEVEIHAYSIMGGQTILVPPEVNVEVKGHGIMGPFEHIDSRGTPGAPHITIKGFSWWGSVGIKRRPRRIKRG